MSGAPTDTEQMPRASTAEPQSGVTPLRAVAAAVAAALAAASLARFGVSVDGALAAAFCVVLVTVSVTDLERRIIPNRIVIPSAAVALAVRTLLDPSPEWAIAALGAALFLLVGALVSPGGMGMGDVKLALLLGAMLGRAVLPALLLASLLSLAPSIGLLVRHGRGGRKMGFPFGPFLAAGAVAVLLAGAPSL